MKAKTLRPAALILIFILVTSVCFLFASRKEGMFIDEIYTFGLSNSSYAPFLSDVKGGDLTGKVFTRSELLDYVSVTDGEGFDFGSVYYNQVNDVHPPLYYWLFNIVSTFDRGSFSMIPALILDYVIYILAVYLLFRLVLKLGGSFYNACSAAVLYGLSLIGLSTMLMIRMYVLLTLLTLVLAWLISCLMADFKPRTCILVGLTLLAGLMTQYYYVFYAFFLCAAYSIYALIKRQYRALLWFIPCALLGALSLLAVFPACLDHLFSGELVSGASAVDNLKTLSQYPVRLTTFTGFLLHGLKAAIYVGFAALAGLAVLLIRRGKSDRRPDIDLRWLVFIVPAFVTFLLVAVISPVDEARYIYNLIPIFVLTVSFIIYMAESAAGEFRNSPKVKAVLLLCLSLFALWEARCAPPDFLYPEYAEYDALLSEYADSPCVYFSDGHFEAITQDLLQLLNFEKFYVTDTASLDGMCEYIGENDGAVIYIDISKFWSSGYNDAEVLKQIADETDFASAIPLYQNGLSATYYIHK